MAYKLAGSAPASLQRPLPDSLEVAAVQTVRLAFGLGSWPEVCSLDAVRCRPLAAAPASQPTAPGGQASASIPGSAQSNDVHNGGISDQQAAGSVGISVAGSIALSEDSAPTCRSSLIDVSYELSVACGPVRAAAAGPLLVTGRRSGTPVAPAAVDARRHRHVHEISAFAL